MSKTLLDNNVEIASRKRPVLLHLLNIAYLLTTGVLVPLPMSKNFNTFWKNMLTALDSFH